MEKLNLNTIEDLTRFQTELNRVIEEHKSQRELEDTIETVPSLSFGTMKRLFESVSECLMNDKKGKSTLKRYINTIKEDKSLRNLFSLHETIEKCTNIKHPELYLNEALNIVTNNNLKTNNFSALGEIVAEAVALSGLNSGEIKDIINNTPLVSESIDYLYSNKKTLNNLNEYVEHYDNVVTFIKENKVTDEVSMVESIDGNEYLDKLNEIAKSIDDEWGKKLVENICLNNLSGLSDEHLFNTYKTSCLTLIENTINNNEDVQTRATFETMKANLERKTYLKENFNTDIVNLAELEYTLM